MLPQWQRRGSRIEYTIALTRADSGRGGLGCAVHGGTYQSLGKHCESLPAEVRVRLDTGSPVRSFGRRSRACDESSCPILFGLALHRRCRQPPLKMIERLAIVSTRRNRLFQAPVAP